MFQMHEAVQKMRQVNFLTGYLTVTVPIASSISLDSNLSSKHFLLWRYPQGMAGSLRPGTFNVQQRLFSKRNATNENHKPMTPTPQQISLHHFVRHWLALLAQLSSKAFNLVPIL